MKPAPRGPEQVLLGHAAVGERERARVGGVPAHLAVRLALLVAGRAVRDDAGWRSRSSPVCRAGDGRDRDDAGDVGAGVGDELLGAVDHPLAVLQARARAHVAGVRARLGLGQAEGAELARRRTAAAATRASAPRAEQVDRLGAQRGVRAQRDRHRRVDPRELLDRERVGERVAAAAAVLLGEGDPHQVELAELGARSRTGSASCGRAPRRRARPRCGEVAHGAPGSAGARRRGRSPRRPAFSQRVAGIGTLPGLWDRRSCSSPD